MHKDNLNVHVFQNRNWGPFHTREFQWKKNGGIGLISEKTEALHAELNERVEAATSKYSATGQFLQYIYSVLAGKNHQKIWSRCLVHEFSLTDIFFNSVLYGCIFLLLLKRCAERCALQLYRTSSSIFILIRKIFNNCIFGRLKNNCVPLNESSSLY